MIITTNISAINSNRQMYKSTMMQTKATQKLASGIRINAGGDDAAGLAISEKMRGQISGLTQASRNVQDGISLIQTAEGVLQEQHSMLQRMRELAVQAENETNTEDDRTTLQAEIDQLKDELTAITDKTEFNTQKLLNGSISQKSSGLHHMEIKVNDLSHKVKEATATANALAQINGQGDCTEANLKSIPIVGFTNEDGSQRTAYDFLKTKTGDITKPDWVWGAVPSQLKQQREAAQIYQLASDNMKKQVDDLNKLTIDNQIQDKLQEAIDEQDMAKDRATNIKGVLEQGLASPNQGTLSNIQIPETGKSVWDMLVESGQSLNDDKQITLALQNLITNQEAIIDSSIEIKEGITKALEEQKKSPYVAGSGLTLQVGANAEQTFILGITKMDAETLGVADIDVIMPTTDMGTLSNMAVIDRAIAIVSGERSKLGAMQNRLEYTIGNLANSTENLQAAESKIRDTDMAKEIMNLTSENLLLQANQSVLAQANQQPSNVLELLQ